MNDGNAVNEARTLEVDLAVKVGVVEDLHRDFSLSVIISFKIEVLYFDILFDILPGQDDLFVYAGTNSRHDRPVNDSEWETHDEDKEPVSVEAAAVDQREDTLDEPGHTEDNGGQVVV